ncbi:MAG: hypothetical protein EXR39_17285 [Betaproteobacteria bacterium]|nr:hypothetical protein [Betaproteobacteria bacterium]
MHRLPYRPVDRPCLAMRERYCAAPARRALAPHLRSRVTYHMGTWHHALTVLDRPARFAVLMWRDGTPADEELITLAAPLTVVIPR